MLDHFCAQHAYEYTVSTSFGDPYGWMYNDFKEKENAGLVRAVPSTSTLPTPGDAQDEPEWPPGDFGTGENFKPTAPDAPRSLQRRAADGGPLSRTLREAARSKAEEASNDALRVWGKIS